MLHQALVTCSPVVRDYSVSTADLEIFKGDSYFENWEQKRVPAIYRGTFSIFEAEYTLWTTILGSANIKVSPTSPLFN